MRWLLLAGLAAVWGLTAFHTVDQAEYVAVTQFGRPVIVFDGGTDAGLHVKLPWPIQAVQRLDRRLQVFDLPPAELPTHDPAGRTIDKMLTIEAFVCWRIAGQDGPELFIRTVGTPERARTILGQRVSSRLGAVVSTMPLDELIRVADPADVDRRSEALRQQLLIGNGENLVELARSRYGIEIVDVRLRRFNYPEQVRSTIAERIKSERYKKVADYESDGRKRAEDIKSEAEREASVIRATAAAQKRRIERLADVDADDIRNQAHARDREFYTFLQKLEAYQKILAETRDVLLLSTKHEFFDLLLNPPRPAMAPAGNGAPPTVAGSQPEVR